MATIVLKQGDFGSSDGVIVGEAALYLPDRSRPGLNEMVPLTAITAIETIADDHSGQVKEAARLGLKGLLATGNPLGLAAGVLAVGKVKQVEFSVHLNDGRSFVASADAGTLAHLREASRTALAGRGEEAEAALRADAVIAKYLAPAAPSLEPARAAAGEAEDAEPKVAARPLPGRAVFGRRRTR